MSLTISKIHLFTDSLEKYHGAATMTMVLKMYNFFKLQLVKLYERAVLLKGRVYITHAHEIQPNWKSTT